MITDLQEVIDNARSFIGKGWTYKLGGDSVKKKEIDCSAFIWRCLGERKYDPKTKVWRNTSWLVSDLSLPYFQRLAKPVPGCVAVYGWSKLPNGKNKVGHCAIVIDPDLHLVIDASSTRGTVAERRVDRFWENPKTEWLVPKGAVYVDESGSMKKLALTVLTLASFWAFYASR